MANLLDEELLRRREDRLRPLRAEAGADYNHWFAQQGQEFMTGGSGAVYLEAASPHPVA